jgi:hypothetical protein
MRILVTGTNGLIGSALVRALRDRGDQVVSLIRPGRLPEIGDVMWSPLEDFIDRPRIGSCDAVINLAGENISRRGGADRKKRIYQSRIKGTRLLCDFMSQLKIPPRVFVCASAVGYYGDRGDTRLTEETGCGEGFLSSLCRDWEAAADKAAEAGIRTVKTRFGIVLSRRGGALAKMLPAFRMALGAVLADGKQYWPWVSLDDAVRAIIFALDNRTVKGPVNVVAPQEATNADFSITLGRVLKRPVFMRIPRWAVGIIFGDLVRQLVLMSSRVAPRKLTEEGFEFRHTDLAETLREILER